MYKNRSERTLRMRSTVSSHRSRRRRHFVRLVIAANTFLPCMDGGMGMPAAANDNAAKIDMLDQIITNRIPRNIRTANHEWNLGSLVVERNCLPRAWLIPWFGHKYDQGRVEKVFMLESLEDTTNVVSVIRTASRNRAQSSSRTWSRG